MLFRRHVCLSNLKHAPLRKLPLTARKTVSVTLNEHGKNVCEGLGKISSYLTLLHLI